MILNFKMLVNREGFPLKKEKSSDWLDRRICAFLKSAVVRKERLIYSKHLQACSTFKIQISVPYFFIGHYNRSLKVFIEYQKNAGMSIKNSPKSFLFFR